MKLSIIESEYQKALFLGEVESLKMNYSSQFYVVKVVISKCEVLKIIGIFLQFGSNILQFCLTL